MSDTYWVEVSDTAMHGTPPKLVDVKTAFDHTGFVSNYAYNNEVKEWIDTNYSEKYKCNGSVVGLTAARKPVYSSMLYVDFDDNPIPDAKKLTKDLRELGIQYSVWSSGGRSIHVHIHCFPKEDWRIPVSQKEWIVSWASSRSAVVDSSIYHPVALFRLPGTVHQKTGKKKELIDFQKGALLDYPLIDSLHTSNVPEDAEATERCIWRLLLTWNFQGGRRYQIYKIVDKAKALGWDAYKTEEHVKWWNSQLNNPLPKDLMENKLWTTMNGS